MYFVLDGELEEITQNGEADEKKIVWKCINVLKEIYKVQTI
jgi:hypothetical protein